MRYHGETSVTFSSSFWSFVAVGFVARRAICGSLGGRRSFCLFLHFARFRLGFPALLLLLLLLLLLFHYYHRPSIREQKSIGCQTHHVRILHGRRHQGFGTHGIPLGTHQHDIKAIPILYLGELRNRRYRNGSNGGFHRQRFEQETIASQVVGVKVVLNLRAERTQDDIHDVTRIHGGWRRKDWVEVVHHLVVVVVVVVGGRGRFLHVVERLYGEKEPTNKKARRQVRNGWIVRMLYQ
mmetsp:Transcript_1112/g.2382  ORF Transcript_1112/g.2382 Transcript_1112/m.2382 type:complete len:238 (-) Transcript_1112:33-746(-)